MGAFGEHGIFTVPGNIPHAAFGEAFCDHPTVLDQSPLLVVKLKILVKLTCPTLLEVS